MDGRQAIDLASALRVDRVVMDVAMPGMDGFEATRRIKTAHPNVEVVGFSGSTPPEQFLAAGADAVFAKPEIEALVEHVARPLSVDA